ncbi:MAG: Uma2 family endonuclease [Gemmatimonadetes bacterium]|nr:Uma2 family endonuclease [Gemmatimonadota bacterium]
MATRLAPGETITFEEFIATVDEDARVEWVNGEIVEMSPVTDRHAEITVFLTTLLNLLASRRQLGRVLHAPFYMKAGPEAGAREPDVLFVRTENLARIRKTYLDGPADLVIEVVSPDSRVRDRGEKFYEYETGGVGEYWIIDPLRNRMEAHRLGQGGYDPIEMDAAGRLRSTVMDGMWLDPAWLRSEPLPDVWWVLEKEWGLI